MMEVDNDAAASSPREDIDTPVPENAPHTASAPESNQIAIQNDAPPGDLEVSTPVPKSATISIQQPLGIEDAKQSDTRADCHKQAPTKTKSADAHQPQALVPVPTTSPEARLPHDMPGCAGAATAKHEHAASNIGIGVPIAQHAMAMHMQPPPPPLPKLTAAQAQRMPQAVLGPPISAATSHEKSETMITHANAAPDNRQSIPEASAQQAAEAAQVAAMISQSLSEPMTRLVEHLTTRNAQTGQRPADVAGAIAEAMTNTMTTFLAQLAPQSAHVTVEPPTKKACTAHAAPSQRAPTPELPWCPKHYQYKWRCEKDGVLHECTTEPGSGTATCSASPKATGTSELINIGLATQAKSTSHTNIAVLSPELHATHVPASPEHLQKSLVGPGLKSKPSLGQMACPTGNPHIQIATVYESQTMSGTTNNQRAIAAPSQPAARSPIMQIPSVLRQPEAMILDDADALQDQNLTANFYTTPPVRIVSISPRVETNIGNMQKQTALAVTHTNKHFALRINDVDPTSLQALVLNAVVHMKGGRRKQAWWSNLGMFELLIDTTAPHSTTTPAIRAAEDVGNLPGLSLQPVRFINIPNENPDAPRPVLVDVVCKILDFEPSVTGANPRWTLTVADRERQRKKITLWGEHATLPLQVGTTLLMRCVEIKYRANPKSQDNRIWLNMNAWGNTAMIIEATGPYASLALA